MKLEAEKRGMADELDVARDTTQRLMKTESKLGFYYYYYYFYFYYYVCYYY